MKKMVANKILLMSSLIILLSTSLVFAGWFGKITGMAPSDSTSINVTIGNNAPTINWVQAVTGQTITESGLTTVYVAFNATDIDLASTLNDASATMNLSYNSIYSASNTSCVKTTDFNSTMRQYNCTIKIAYFQPNGVWNVTATITDNNGATGTNNSLMFTLAEGININVTQTSASWASLSTSSQNVGSDTNPLVVNNTGNANGKSIYITGYNLHGASNSSQILPVANFSSGPSSPGCDNTALVNATSTQISGLTLNRGPGSPGLLNVYLCIEDVPSTLSSQSYTSAAYGNWVFLAA